jgi:hypothetical protein
MRVALSKQKAVDILFPFLRTSSEYWIGNYDFDFVILSFYFLSPYSVQLNFEFHRVVHSNTDNCSEQEVHSVMRFPRSSYRDVQNFGARSVRLNAEEKVKKPAAEVRFQYSFCYQLQFVFRCCCVCFVSGPAHILHLTVASGWNKERCPPEIELSVTVTVKSSILVNLLYLLTTREWL